MIRRHVFGVTRIVVALLTAFVVIDTVRANAVAFGAPGVITFLSSLTCDVNIIAAVCFALGGYYAFRRRHDPGWFTMFRAVTAATVVTMSVTYLLVYGQQVIAAGTFFTFENLMLHVFMPAYGLIDWLFSPLDNRLSFRQFWLVLVFPVIWFVYSFTRGALTGSYVYEFLNPELTGGYTNPLLSSVGVLLGFLLAAIAVIAFDRAVTENRFDRRT